MWIPKPIGFTAPARPERPLPRQIIIVLPADSGLCCGDVNARPALPASLCNGRAGNPPEPPAGAAQNGASCTGAHHTTACRAACRRHGRCARHVGIHRAREATTRSLRPRPPLPMPPAPAAVGLGSRRRRLRRSSSSITGAIPGARACGARRGAVRPVQLAARIERPAKATCRWAAPGARHFLGFLSPRVNDSVGRPGILKL